MAHRNEGTKHVANPHRVRIEDDRPVRGQGEDDTHGQSWPAVAAEVRDAVEESGRGDDSQ
jgi:hypothetical protein